MREFFQEKFQLPVEFFNPLRNVAVGGDLNIEEIGRKAHTHGRTGRPGAARHEQLPDGAQSPSGERRPPPHLAERRPAFMLAGICLLACDRRLVALLRSRPTMSKEALVASLHPKVSELKGYESRMNSIRSAIKAQKAGRSSHTRQSMPGSTGAASPEP